MQLVGLWVENPDFCVCPQVKSYARFTQIYDQQDAKSRPMSAMAKASPQGAETPVVSRPKSAHVSSSTTPQRSPFRPPSAHMQHRSLDASSPVQYGSPMTPQATLVVATCRGSSPALSAMQRTALTRFTLRRLREHRRGTKASRTSRRAGSSSTSRSGAGWPAKPTRWLQWPRL